MCADILLRTVIFSNQNKRSPKYLLVFIFFCFLAEWGHWT